MTDQEINTAIAEACGIVEGFPSGGSILLPYKYHNPITGEKYLELPYYTTDLNAMHEAEAVLTPEQRIKRVQQLCIICDRDYGGVLMPSDVMSPIEMTSMFLDCTARQRAEAFLRALNKWKE